MSSAEHVMQLLHELESFTILPLIAGALVIMALAVSVSGIKISGIRLLYLLAVALAAFWFSEQLTDINGQFYLSIASELFGAMLVIVLLNEWVSSQRWLFPVVFVVVLLSTLLINFGGVLFEGFFTNLSAELIGAFVIMVLIERREWLWSDPHSVHELQLQAFENELRGKAQLKYERLLIERRAEISKQLAEEMDGWKTNPEWDVMVKIAAADPKAVQHKARQLARAFSDVHVTRVETSASAGVAHCYLLGTLVLPPAPTASRPSAQSRRKAPVNTDPGEQETEEVRGVSADKAKRKRH